MLLTHIRWISGWMMKRYVWFTPFAHIAHLDYLTTSKIRSDYDSNVDNLLLSPISFYLYPLENEPIKQWCHYFRHRSLKQIMLSTLNSDYRLNRTDDTLLLPPAWLVWADWFIRRKKCTYPVLWCMPGTSSTRYCLSYIMSSSWSLYAHPLNYIQLQAAEWNIDYFWNFRISILPWRRV